MASELRRLFFTCAALSLCLTIGCESKGPTQLCDGFQSYENAQSIRNKLGRAGVIGQWHEKVQAVKPPDRRPPYEMLTLSGPFRFSGIDGNLALTLYNDRLMEAQFSALKGSEYLAKLQKENPKIPNVACKEITVNRRTKFEYFVDPDGAVRFLWEDPKLADEWDEWVRNNT